MSKIVETFARAICRAQWTRETDIDPDMAEDEWRSFLDEARAALRAVKPEDVSDAMIDAYFAQCETVILGETNADNLRRAIAAAIAAGA